MTPRFRLALGVVAAGLVLTACSGGGGSAEPDPSSSGPYQYPWESACELLVGVDVDAMIGSPQGDPNSSLPNHCTWGHLEDGTPVAKLQLYLQPEGGRAYYDHMAALYGNAVAIDGLGDIATVHYGSDLFIVSGDKLIWLTISRDSGEDATDTLISIANDVLAQTDW